MTATLRVNVLEGRMAPVMGLVSWLDSHASATVVQHPMLDRMLIVWCCRLLVRFKRAWRTQQATAGIFAGPHAYHQRTYHFALEGVPIRG